MCLYIKEFFFFLFKKMKFFSLFEVIMHYFSIFREHNAI